MDFPQMSSAHFLFIPAVLVVGVVIGWILGSRAAADAYAADLKRREERAARKQYPPRRPGARPRALRREGVSRRAPFADPRRGRERRGKGRLLSSAVSFSAVFAAR